MILHSPSLLPTTAAATAPHAVTAADLSIIGCVAQCLPVVARSAAMPARNSIGPVGRMRLNAQIGGLRLMARISPLTARTVLAISDARRRAVLAFMHDGELSAVESQALRSIDEAAHMTELSDLARRCGDWVRDTGETELSPYLMRQVRELEAA